MTSAPRRVSASRSSRPFRSATMPTAQSMHKAPVSCGAHWVSRPLSALLLACFASRAEVPPLLRRRFLDVNVGRAARCGWGTMLRPYCPFNPECVEDWSFTSTWFSRDVVRAWTVGTEQERGGQVVEDHGLAGSGESPRALRWHTGRHARITVLDVVDGGRAHRPQGEQPSA